MAVESYADYPKLGRFFLSDNNEVFAVGKILKVDNNTGQDKYKLWEIVSAKDKS